MQKPLRVSLAPVIGEANLGLAIMSKYINMKVCVSKQSHFFFLPAFEYGSITFTLLLFNCSGMQLINTAFGAAASESFHPLF